MTRANFFFTLFVVIIKQTSKSVKNTMSFFSALLLVNNIYLLSCCFLNLPSGDKKLKIGRWGLNIPKCL